MDDAYTASLVQTFEALRREVAALNSNLQVGTADSFAYQLIRSFALLTDVKARQKQELEIKNADRRF